LEVQINKINSSISVRANHVSPIERSTVDERRFQTDLRQSVPSNVELERQRSGSPQRKHPRNDQHGQHEDATSYSGDRSENCFFDSQLQVGLTVYNDFKVSRFKFYKFK
jgi:hypothetical protein